MCTSCDVYTSNNMGTWGTGPTSLYTCHTESVDASCSSYTTMPVVQGNRPITAMVGYLKRSRTSIFDYCLRHNLAEHSPLGILDRVVFVLETGTEVVSTGFPRW